MRDETMALGGNEKSIGARSSSEYCNYASGKERSLILYTSRLISFHPIYVLRMKVRLNMFSWMEA